MGLLIILNQFVKYQNFKSPFTIFLEKLRKNGKKTKKYRLSKVDRF